MSMTSPADVAAAIVAATAISGTTAPGSAEELRIWTAVVTQLQAMLATATVTTDVIAIPTTGTVPGTGLVAPVGGGPVTGVATETGTASGTSSRAGGAIV